MTIWYMMSTVIRMKTLNIDKIPDDLHLAFKVLCTPHGTTMRNQLMAFMRAAVAAKRIISDTGGNGFFNPPGGDK